MPNNMPATRPLIQANLPAWNGYNAEMLKHFLLLPILILTSCVSQRTLDPQPISDERILQIKVGMLESEVISLMGSPSSKTVMQGTTILGWRSMRYAHRSFGEQFWFGETPTTTESCTR